VVATTIEAGEDVAILIDTCTVRPGYYELSIRPEEESFITQIERFLASSYGS
jgi:hypothetical protein